MSMLRVKWYIEAWIANESDESKVIYRSLNSKWECSEYTEGLNKGCSTLGLAKGKIYLQNNYCWRWMEGTTCWRCIESTRYLGTRKQCLDQQKVKCIFCYFVHCFYIYIEYNNLEFLEQNQQKSNKNPTWLWCFWQWIVVWRVFNC